MSEQEADMAKQGRFFSEREIRRISHLLASTELNLKDIAERMRCSHSAIVAINRKLQIRIYRGRRTHWVALDPTGTD
jgi:DNA-directed RNA polymerase specialized sigma subunit